MRTTILLSAFLCAGLTPHSALAVKPQKAPEIKVDVVQASDPAPSGREVLVNVTLKPPEGITINRYPGITLKVDKTRGAKVSDSEVFVGSREPIEDPAEFPFKTIDPLPVKVTPTASSGEAQIEGLLTFTYCVKKSGYCAPAKQRVTIPVRVSSS